MKTIQVLAVVTLSASLGACIVAPPRPYYADSGAPAAAPATVVAAPYPYYAIPAPGYVWINHFNYGWGWRHPHHGWHRGWR